MLYAATIQCGLASLHGTPMGMQLPHMVHNNLEMLSTMDQWQTPMLYAATIQCGLASLHGTPMDLLVPCYGLNTASHGLF
jgi:hypothetical protein